MIKKTTYILAAVIMSFATVILPASASEISGFVSTTGNPTQTSTPSPTPSPSTTPAPTLTPTPTPTATSSEIAGEIVAGNVDNGNTDLYFSVPSNNNQYNNQYDQPTFNANPVLTATVATPTPEQSPVIDDPMKFLTPPNFGPRYGLGDASTTYPGFNSIASISSGSNASDQSTLTGTGGPDRDYSLAELLPHSAGEIFGNGGDADTSGLEANTANALNSANGLSVSQLLYIAILALIVIASMGYAISRSAPHGTDVLTS